MVLRLIQNISFIKNLTVVLKYIITNIYQRFKVHLNFTIKLKFKSLNKYVEETKNPGLNYSESAGCNSNVCR